MAQKPSIPKGTRDFSPAQVARRNYIIDTIKQSFTRYGFQPIETPSMENSSTLMGKYGEEGDRLIFKILNSGDFMKNIKDFSEIVFGKDFETEYTESEVSGMPVTTGKISDIDSNKLSTFISEKALRYDLTVPFARYVVQHQNEIELPFKRYQIQPVWRADRPQKGRYREFYQCDADVVGSDSLWQEAEFIQLYDQVFTDLGLKGTTIKVNNRKILAGIAEVMNAQEKLIDFTVALDKLDKIGEEKVKEEMLEKGISEEAIEKLAPIFRLRGSFQEQIDQLKELLVTSEAGQQGIKELSFIQQIIDANPLQTAKLELDVTLARGLNYYTGAIFEVSAPAGVKMGSIGGGGRYDDLAGIFGRDDISGVGISFGLDRIYLVMEELQLFPETVTANTKVLFINFGEAEAGYAFTAVQQLRNKKINAELYPDAAKMKKQMTYADRRDIPFVVLAGTNEISDKTYTLKNMKTGEQQTLVLKDLVEKLSF
ncbi:histidine--tRNA ligase [Gangjinia marincola]